MPQSLGSIQPGSTGGDDQDQEAQQQAPDAAPTPEQQAPETPAQPAPAPEAPKTPDTPAVEEKSAAVPGERPKLGIAQEVAMPQEPSGEVDIIKLVDTIFHQAKSHKASDIHIEPREEEVMVRFRIDGEFSEYFVFPKQLGRAISTRVMVLAGLKIDERRIPQDGKIIFKTENERIDMRVSTFPAMHGEKIVLRLLERDAKAKKLQDLGYSGKALDTIETNLKRTYGMVLVTGPTGSGKSTTLFSMLSKYDPFKFNISTLEDPIEYVIDGVNQAQVHAEIGFDFADGLRSLVRQDPDIIMIGEIRDKVSANLAIQAALTGHLVFATVHANTAAATIQRLANMGVDPFLAASALNLIISQRLVRRICDHCKVPAEVPAEQIDSIKEYFGGEAEAKKIQFMTGKGCSKCGNTGFKGRVAIYEVLPVTPAISQMIIKEPVASSIQKVALAEGMIPIKENGLELAKLGITSLEEVLLAADVQT